MSHIKPASFQNKICKIVKKIPRGKISTYKKIAELARKPKAHRAVGNILAKNKNPEVPCHRVIRKNGWIGGYRNGTVEKIKILKEEGIKIKNGKIDLEKYLFKG